MTNPFNTIARSFKFSGILAQLIIINAVVFLTVNVSFNLGLINLLDFLALPASFSLYIKRFWTIFSYMFTHFDLGHVFYNLLFLFFMGQIFNLIVGPQRFLFVYILGGICGGLLYMVFENLFFNGSSYLVGASASATAISVVAGVFAPNMPVNLIFLGEVRLKWVVIGYFVISSIVDISVNTGGKISHVGGAIFGLIYGLNLKNGLDLLSWLSQMKWKSRSRLKVSYRQNSALSERENLGQSDEKQLDELLDKINKSGYESLSKSEKERLKNLSQRR